MTPTWKAARCGDPPAPRLRLGHHFARSNPTPSRWPGGDQIWDSFAPAGSCRLFGKPQCRPYCPAPGGFAFHTTHAENSPLRPRIVTVVRACGGAAGSEPGGGELRKVTILLNRRAVQTFEQLVADISEALGFPQWRNNRVRRLFNLRGREIRSVSDFFRNDDLFVAAGRERPSLQEVQQVLEELFPDSGGFHGMVLEAWERLLRPLAKASKADSGFHEDPEHLQSLGDRAPQNRREERHKQEQTRGEGRGAKSRVRNLKAVAERPNGMEAACRRMGSRREPLASIRVPDSPPAVDIQKEVADRVSVRRDAKDEGAVEEAAENSCHPQKAQGELEKRGVSSCSLVANRTVSGGKVDGRSGVPGIPDCPVAKTGNKTQSCAEGGQERGPPTRASSCEHGGGTGSPLLVARGAADWAPEFPDPVPAGAVLRHSDIERYYELGRVVGDGNFAVVKECRRWDAGIGSPPFAMKIIDRAKLRGKEHMAQNEISISQSLRHPNVVRFLWHYETAEHIYLLMELVAGGDLFDAITESVRFPEVQAARLLQDVCQALAYIHGKCIVHRDVKPENLLIQRNGDGSSTLKLADFGLATVVTEPIFTVCGTPTYVAPEILAEKGYGVAVDIGSHYPPRGQKFNFINGMWVGPRAKLPGGETTDAGEGQ
ncbi:serine/threonine-protein kinase DCLK3-like [Arapaima gigas]